MSKSMSEIRKDQDTLFYRCFFFVGSLFIFSIALYSLILKSLHTLTFSASPTISETILSLVAGTIVVLFASFTYFLFHVCVLQKKKKELEQLTELGLVSVQVAHDMRSPLASMKVLVSSLEEYVNADTKDASQILHVLANANHRLENICEDLLAKQRGTTEPIRGFNLHKMLDEFVEEAKANYFFSKVNISRDYHPQAIQFSGRQSRLQRVFANVIKNAMEAMQFEGEIHIVTTLKDNQVTVSIQDNGPGISAKKVEALMSGSAKSGKVKGHGLGMKFVHEVIRNHKGKLFISSQEGKGTTVHVQLPCFVGVQKFVADRTSVRANALEQIQSDLPIDDKTHA